MNPKHTPSRWYLMFLLLVSGVLVLGIIQWSFLPLLIQGGQISKTAVLELSASHTSKFAAPFKCLFGDGPNPCLVQSRITVRRIASRAVRLPDAPISGQDDFSLTHRALRAPPSA
jgi:hypothetical protein